MVEYGHGIVYIVEHLWNSVHMLERWVELKCLEEAIQVTFGNTNSSCFGKSHHSH